MSGDPMTEQDNVVLFTRDKGPVCWEIPLFDVDDAELDSRVSSFLSAPLEWLWESDRHQPPAPDWANRHLPSKRRLARLDKNMPSLLATDLRERTIDGVGRNVFLYALAPEIMETPDDKSLANAISDFVTSDAGPIGAVVVQMGDQNDAHLFLRPRDASGLKRHLRSLQFHLDKPSKVVPYWRLGVIALEALFGVSGGAGT